MAYIKHNFEDGQVLEASLLNEMDDQIALNEAGLNDVIEDIEAVDTKATEAKAIAEGKSTGYVFDTVSAMNTWITSHKSELKLGDNLLNDTKNTRDFSHEMNWWE